jgi:2-methylcitrate dehydratase PrpD
MAGSQKQSTQHSRWDGATWVGVGAGAGAAFGAAIGGGAGIAIGLAIGAGVGVSLAAWRTHHGPNAPQ